MFFAHGAEGHKLSDGDKLSRTHDYVFAHGAEYSHACIGFPRILSVCLYVENFQDFLVETRLYDLEVEIQSHIVFDAVA